MTIAASPFRVQAIIRGLEAWL